MKKENYQTRETYKTKQTASCKQGFVKPTVITVRCQRIPPPTGLLCVDCCYRNHWFASPETEEPRTLDLAQSPPQRDG
jgi:hypothetical protein